MRLDLKMLSIACVAGLTLGLPAGTASARSAPVLQVPEHPVDTTLSLLGASARGVLVRQGVPSVHPPTADSGTQVERDFSGPEGGELIRRPDLERSPAGFPSPEVLGVQGDTIGWQQQILPSGIYYYQVHRMNLRTGKDIQEGEMPPALAFTGTQWLTDEITNYSDYPFPPPVLKSYPSTGLPGGEGTLLKPTDIIPDAGNTTTLTADDSLALQASYVNSDLTVPDGAPRYTLDLVDLVHRTKQTLVNSVADVITSVALSPTTIAWASRLADGPLVIHERARAGNVVSSYTDPDPKADGTHLAVADGQAAYLVATAGQTVMRVVTGGSAQTVDVPDGSSGIAAVGPRFLTAVGGAPSVAGVYSDNAGTVTRVATVPQRTYPITSLALDGDRILYTDNSVTNGGSSLWQRSLTGNNRPAFGPESEVATDPAKDGDLRPTRGISFSAGRGAVVSAHDDWSWHLLDRGHETGAIPGSDTLKVSGPYTLSDGKVYGTEGNLVWTAPSVPGQTVERMDIFGSSVVYMRRHDDGSGRQLMLDDVEHPGPLELADHPDSPDCSPLSLLAIWGNLVAWDWCSGEPVTLKNIVTGYAQQVSASLGQTISTLALGDGVLAWQDYLGTQVVDLTDSHLVPTPLPPGPSGSLGSARTLILDSHWLVRQVIDRHGYDAGFDVQPLPFATKTRPRLIGTAAPHGFTPDGDGHADVWRPQFDVTKPMRGVELTITDQATGKVLRTLDGTAPDGSIRDLAWDGRTKKGAVIPRGTYRWALTGRATDGGGALIAQNGDDTVTGTIEIDATR